MTPAAFRTARADLGLTQVQMARAVGVSPRTVQYWEAGVTPVSATAAKLVAIMVEGKSRG